MSLAEQLSARFPKPQYCSDLHQYLPCGHCRITGSIYEIAILTVRFIDCCHSPSTPCVLRYSKQERRRKDEAVRATIMQKLIETGERERLKDLLRERLIQCGWRDELKVCLFSLQTYMPLLFDTHIQGGYIMRLVAVDWFKLFSGLSPRLHLRPRYMVHQPTDSGNSRLACFSCRLYSAFEAISN